MSGGVVLVMSGEVVLVMSGEVVSVSVPASVEVVPASGVW